MPGGCRVSWNLLLMLTPFFLLVLVFGALVAVALFQARDEDVPTIWRDCISVFAQLVHRVPVINRTAGAAEDGPAEHHQQAESPKEESL
jgi:hypothetical protein